MDRLKLLLGDLGPQLLVLDLVQMRVDRPQYGTRSALTPTRCGTATDDATAVHSPAGGLAEDMRLNIELRLRDMELLPLHQQRGDAGEGLPKPLLPLLLLAPLPLVPMQGSRVKSRCLHLTYPARWLQCRVGGRLSCGGSMHQDATGDD